MIWLDNAATTLIKPYSVGAAVARAMREAASVGRGAHRPGALAAETVFEAREIADSLFNAGGPERVVFTFNATHALNIALRSFDLRGKRAVVSGWEHNSVVRPLAAAGAEIVPAAGPLFDREANLRAFERALTPDTALAAVCHVSNVFGFILPIEEIGRICRARGIPLVVDASQSAGVLPIDLQGVGADFIAMPGHKSLLGPQGTGLLLVGENAPIRPLLAGGTGSVSLSREMPDFLPDALEAGTHNVPGIAGLAEGMRFVASRGTEAILAHERELAREAARLLERTGRARCFISDDPDAQTGVLSFVIEGMDSQTAAVRLGEAGVAVRGGLHCAPLAHESAGTEGTVRASFSVFNTLSDAEGLARAVARL
ncbi:MAG: aminotransferase class V-fold PLP-dependent enzyme [Oscillospiraceae bacterium]|nr:aminotransferase class V-fold PLP-dependent enzyme [Oscillospiraceae bacterium]